MAADWDLIPAPTLTFFSNLDQFKAIALPILETELTFNTLALTALHEARPDARGIVMGLMNCTGCPAPHQTVLISPGFKGIGCQLYIAPPPSCHAAAEVIANQLPSLPCTTICSTAAGMDAILPLCNWQTKHLMNVMVYKRKRDNGSNRAVPAISTTTAPAVPVLQAQCSSAAVAVADATAGAAASKLGTATESVQLRTCSATMPSDERLVLDWAGSFLAEVFHLHNAPPPDQLAAMVMPRLQQGLYYVLESATGAPVCMASHFPTSSESTRVTMLWTPKDCRSRGYGTQTVARLCKVLASQGFKHICLMADQDQPAVARLYKAAGFDTVGEMFMAEKPAEAPVKTLMYNN